MQKAPDKHGVDNSQKHIACEKNTYKSKALYMRTKDRRHTEPANDLFRNYEQPKQTVSFNTYGFNKLRVIAQPEDGTYDVQNRQMPSSVEHAENIVNTSTQPYHMPNTHNKSIHRQ